MVSASDKPELIQIKKVKKGGHEHHGGAWKMAYADFVTTLMSLFLVLWLANISIKKTTSTRQECRIYRPDLKLYALYMTYPNLQDQHSAQVPEDSKQAKSIYKSTAYRTPPGSSCVGSQSNSNAIDQLRAQLENYATITCNDDGLHINVSPSQDDLFFKGTSVLTEYGKTIMQQVALSLRAVPNELQIIGLPDADYGGTDLALRRGQTVEQSMKAAGIPQSRIQQVSGNSHYTEAQSQHGGTQYNRIEILLLP